MTAGGRPLPTVVSREDWRAALDELRIREKELTRMGDAVSAQRRRLPMVRIDRDYTFETIDGPASLLDLFEGRSQLIVYHFMFDPDWEEGCEGCSWVVDAMTHPAHLHARDASLVLISRAPLEKLQRYRARMGWNHLWHSSSGSDFNRDFGATTRHGEQHGVTVFLRLEADVFQTYNTTRRGVEHLGSHWTWLDLTPFGRQETWEDSPPGWPQTEPYVWLRRHDDYGDAGSG